MASVDGSKILYLNKHAQSDIASIKIFDAEREGRALETLCRCFVGAKNEKISRKTIKNYELLNGAIASDGKKIAYTYHKKGKKNAQLVIGRVTADKIVYKNIKLEFNPLYISFNKQNTLLAAHNDKQSTIIGL